jgi:hypothetical protein
MNEGTEYRPSDCQVKRRDNLVYLVGQALGYSREMALPVAAFQQVTRVAVDVTYGDASDADLREAAEQCLADLDHMVESQPLRRALRKVIDEIEDVNATGAGDPLAGVPDTTNELATTDETPRKRPTAEGR